MIEAGYSRNFNSNGIPFNPPVTDGVLDQYTPIIGGSRCENITGVPKWVPIPERRRIWANMLLDQFLLNADPMPESQVYSDMTPRRLGEVAYTVGVLRDVTIGGQQEIQIAGADIDTAEPGVKPQLQSLIDWSKRSLFMQKVQQGEEYASGIGEAYFRLRLSGVRGGTQGEQDVRIDLFHPTFVFPEYDQNDEMESCALMWEEQQKVQGTMQTVLFKDEYVYGPDGAVYETAAWYELTTAPSLEDLKLIRYEKDTKGNSIQNVRLDLPKIPVFHLMNMWKASNHGESDFAPYTDLVKEMNASATDLAAAASLLGIPPLIISGLKGKVREGTMRDTDADTVGPGQMWHVDANGKAEYLDNSNLLKCAMDYVREIEKKLFTHLRLPRLFGGDTANLRDIESARAMKMLMASLYARVNQKRSLRDIFYSQLLTTVAVMLTSVSKMSGAAPKDVTLSLGSILPLDNAQDIDLIVALWAQGKGPVSAETAVRMAKNAGVPVIDSGREVAAINKQLTPVAAPVPGAGSDPSKPPFRMGNRPPQTPSKAA